MPRVTLAQLADALRAVIGDAVEADCCGMLDYESIGAAEELLNRLTPSRRAGSGRAMSGKTIARTSTANEQ